MSDKTVWSKYTKKQLGELNVFSEDYRKFISECKTERECTDEIVNRLEEQGFKELELLVKNGTKIKAGDKIEIREKSKSLQRYKDILEVTGGRLVPAWIDVDQENLSGTVTELPLREQIDVPVNETLIVELYSK